MEQVRQAALETVYPETGFAPEDPRLTPVGMSLVAYRNRLRMERFSQLVDQGHTNLLGAALAAGFGSYALFHRVFRAMGRGTPREFLRSRAC